MKNKINFSLLIYALITFFCGVCWIHYMISEHTVLAIIWAFLFGVWVCILDEERKTERDKMEVKIKYFDKDIEKLTYIGGFDKSNWIDLRASETVELKKGEYKLIPLGIGMKLPYGYEAHLVPRSSTFKNYGIIQTNHQGVIDSSYCGDNDEWKFPALAMRNTVINKGDRICQFRIMEQMPKIKFTEVEHLEDNDRGGIGSSGVK